MWCGDGAVVELSWMPRGGWAQKIEPVAQWSSLMLRRCRLRIQAIIEARTQ